MSARLNRIVFERLKDGRWWVQDRETGHGAAAKTREAAAKALAEVLEKVANADLSRPTPALTKEEILGMADAAGDSSELLLCEFDNVSSREIRREELDNGDIRMTDLDTGVVAEGATAGDARRKLADRLDELQAQGAEFKGDGVVTYNNEVAE